jgi:uncharacterized protein YcbK (DUF882 family)
VLAFHISEFKTTLSQNPMEHFADRMQDYTRAKCKELETLRRERDSERDEKERVMRGIDDLVKQVERREGLVLQKMSLLLNAKKAKIGELKGRVQELEEIAAAAGTAPQ